MRTLTRNTIDICERRRECEKNLSRSAESLKLDLNGDSVILTVYMCNNNGEQIAVATIGSAGNGRD